MMYAQSSDTIFAQNWTKYLVYMTIVFLCAERIKQYLYTPNTRKY
jgi:hypothetical protein